MRFCGECKTWFDSKLPHYCVGGPEEGHTFRFEVSSRMSSRVIGDPEHHDADWFGPPHVLHVRAWSLPAAAHKAAELPFAAWSMWEPAEDES